MLKNLIKFWLEKHTTLTEKDYIINNNIINVFTNVSIIDEYLQLNKFPNFIQFGYVNGNFDCTNNNMTSLEGCPIKIKGNFYCSYNKLESLKGCPKEIGGSFICRKNKLLSLKYCPQIINGTFDCSFNEIKNFENSPKIVKGIFDCTYNEIENLNGLTKNLYGKFYGENQKNGKSFTNKNYEIYKNIEKNIYNK